MRSIATSLAILLAILLSLPTYSVAGGVEIGATIYPAPVGWVYRLSEPVQVLGCRTGEGYISIRSPETDTLILPTPDCRELITGSGVVGLKIVRQDVWGNMSVVVGGETIVYTTLDEVLYAPYRIYPVYPNTPQTRDPTYYPIYMNGFPPDFVGRGMSIITSRTTWMVIDGDTVYRPLHQILGIPEDCVSGLTAPRLVAVDVCLPPNSEVLRREDGEVYMLRIGDWIVSFATPPAEALTQAGVLRRKALGGVIHVASIPIEAYIYSPSLEELDRYVATPLKTCKALPGWVGERRVTWFGDYRGLPSELLLYSDGERHYACLGPTDWLRATSPPRPQLPPIAEFPADIVVRGEGLVITVDGGIYMAGDTIPYEEYVGRTRILVAQGLYILDDGQPQPLIIYLATRPEIVILGITALFIMSAVMVRRHVSGRLKILDIDIDIPPATEIVEGEELERIVRNEYEGHGRWPRGIDLAMRRGVIPKKPEPPDQLLIPPSHPVPQHVEELVYSLVSILEENGFILRRISPAIGVATRRSGRYLDIIPVIIMETPTPQRFIRLLKKYYEGGGTRGGGYERVGGIIIVSPTKPDWMHATSVEGREAKAVLHEEATKLLRDDWIVAWYGGDDALQVYRVLLRTLRVV